MLKFKPKDANISDEELLAPFDYMKIFAPKSVDELRRIAGQAAPVGSDSYGSSSGAPLARGAEPASEESIDDLL